MRVMFTVTFCVLVFCGCTIAEEAASLKKPAIAKEVSDALTWDFGSVPQGQRVTHNFVLKNEGSSALTVNEIHTSCGCTASAIKKKVLAPGEETEIEVAFDSKGYSGKVEQFVYVNTDSLDNPIVRYIIKANVVK